MTKKQAELDHLAVELPAEAEQALRFEKARSAQAWRGA